jgi:MscS family membrane protein
MEGIESLIHFIIHGKYSHYIWLVLLLPVTLVSSWYVSKFLLWIFQSIIYRVFSAPNGFFKKYLPSSINPIALIITSCIFELIQSLYPLSKELKNILYYFNTSLFAFSLVWLIISLVNNFFIILQDTLTKGSKKSAAAILPLLNRVVKITIIAVGALSTLNNWGFDIAAILAALGVGGIAIALASQKSIENLFGGIVLALDQPIRVGDFGKFNNIIGTVIDVGLRSTKIQTLSRTIVTIPNATLSAESIETYAYRDKILMTHNILIKYETTSSGLQSSIKKIQTMLIKHDKVDTTGARVKINKFDLHGINMEIFAYALTSNLIEYLEIQQDIIIKIIEIINKETAGFATPPGHSIKHT